ARARRRSRPRAQRRAQCRRDARAQPRRRLRRGILPGARQDRRAMIGRIRTRWQASATHLLISVLIGLAMLLLMLELWYPSPLFEAAGGNGLFLIVVGVDIVIGPLITLVIFKRGKPGLKLDLALIAVLQLAALTYGAR